MTDVSLFDEMSEITAALLRNYPDLCDSLTYECWFEFRQLTRRRMPQLDEAERRELFEQWLTHDRARRHARIKATSAKMWAYLDHCARANGPGKSFVCPCGAALDNPADPAVDGGACAACAGGAAEVKNGADYHASKTYLATYDETTTSGNCHNPTTRRCSCRRTNAMQPERQYGPHPKTR
jgi:hypothetical protein